MIGPYDLSGSFGVPGEIEHPNVIEASKKVINACKQNNKSCGTQIADPNKTNVDKALNFGYSFVILGSDLFVFSEWAKKMSNLMKDLN